MTPMSPDAVFRYKLALIRDAEEHHYLVPGTRAYQLVNGQKVAVKTMGLQARQTLVVFQERHGLKKTGVLDAATRAALIPPLPVDPNVAAVRWMGQHLGPKEQFGSNDGPWLRAEEHLVNEDYMHTGHEPYCACIGLEVATFEACHLNVRTMFANLNVDYCPAIYDAILNHRVSSDGHYRFVHTNPAAPHEGDILIAAWGGPDSNPHGDHFMRARGAQPLLGGGMVATREANTGPGLGGNQSDGDGMYDRERPLSCIVIAGRLERVVTATAAAA